VLPAGLRVPVVVFDLEWSSPFAYTCNACSRCCYGKAILVGPYEVLRLARNRGLTTTELLAACVEGGGVLLRVRPDGGCVFLTERGCGVHPDRPLACRLYPLGRNIDAQGRERFGHLPPHPQTAGVYGRDGTVGDYLSRQGVEPYFAVGARYAGLYQRMVAVLARLAEGGVEAEAAAAPGMGPASPWLDVDATVAAYCRERDLAPPATLEEAVDLHIRAVDAWLEGLATSLPAAPPAA